MELNASLHIDPDVSHDLDEFLKGWKACASLSALGGTLRQRVFFERKVRVDRFNVLHLWLHPQEGELTWAWYVDGYVKLSRVERNGLAGSLEEAVVAVDAAVAELKALAPA
ncbi:hypothetical protein ACFOYU_09960 [Microvirga sp. GCM10011540]|uniref:hypothetical protein n=1 Tax=Microvirga sp. GCM10011540 TaxID=3317338 RepID=UPI00361AEA38